MRAKLQTLDDLQCDYLTILQTQSETFNTDDMVFEVLKQVEMIKDIVWEFDAYGNVYVTKGKSETYPCFVSHLDTVHKNRDDFRIYNENGVLYAMTWDKGQPVQVGIGGDDKCGIIGCLEILIRLKNVKVAFFLDEEKGCLGSAAGKLDFFDDCRFAIQIDRKGSGDIITSGMGTELCSAEFSKHIKEIGAVYNYESCTGMSTDVVKLKNRGLEISVVNLSAGYYEPHTKQEYIVIDEMLNCFNFCMTMSGFKTVFPHKPKKSQTPNYSKGAYAGGYKTPAGIAPWKGNPYKQEKNASVKDDVSNCLNCSKKLQGVDVGEGCCMACIAGFFNLPKSELQRVTDDGNETLKLITGETDGKKRLKLVSSKNDDPEVAAPTLPQQMLRFLPADGCVFCSNKLISEPEKSRGYCRGCLYCRCGNMILEAELLNANLCTQCMETINNTAKKTCTTVECSNTLMNESEISWEMCGVCLAESENERYACYGI